MTVSTIILSLVGEFVQCFTAPGFVHFTHFMLAHMTLLGQPHCVTETMRLTGWHRLVHWTAPYAFMKRARFSCRQLSLKLLERLVRRLNLPAELLIVIDDVLVKKWGRKFFGLACYRDPTDKNPGASKRKVWGHCWVVAGLLYEKTRGSWYCFPLAALLFVPEKLCSKAWPFATKIALAAKLLRRLALVGRRIVLVVDNLYAKAELLELEGVILVSRPRCNAALFDPPPPRPPGKRGRSATYGKQFSAAHLWGRRKSKRRKLEVLIYGKQVTIDAFVDVLVASPTLGGRKILVVIFPRRDGKLNVFCTTDLELTPERLLELYAARFKIEDAFDELKTHGGMGDYRQRGFKAIKRHVTLTLLAHSLLKLAALLLPGAEQVQAEPWWAPQGPPSVTRLRRECARVFGISGGLHDTLKQAKNRPHKRAAQRNRTKAYAAVAQKF